MANKGYHEIFPMEEYYEKMIEPLGREYKYRKGSKRVCPFHHDKAPSMGIMQNRDGTEIFHCFGCGKKGNIIMMHKYIEQEYHGRNLTDNQAIKELCQIFGQDYSKYIKESREEAKQAARDVMKFYDSTAGAEMTDRVFAEKILEGKKEYRDSRYYNGLLIQLINAKIEKQE